MQQIYKNYTASLILAGVFKKFSDQYFGFSMRATLRLVDVRPTVTAEG